MKNNSQKIEQLPPEQKKNAFFIAVAMSVILVFASLYYFSPLTDIAITFFHANIQLAILAAIYAISSILIRITVPRRTAISALPTNWARPCPITIPDKRIKAATLTIGLRS